MDFLTIVSHGNLCRYLNHLVRLDPIKLIMILLYFSLLFLPPGYGRMLLDILVWNIFFNNFITWKSL